MTPLDVERCAHWLVQVGTIDRMLRSRKMATLTVLVDGAEVAMELPYPHWHAALRADRAGLLEAMQRSGMDTSELRK
jgi:hypothetical protein